MQLPISAFIITQNEEARLARTIAALRSWAGEIVVVDSGSTDRTVEIACGMGARVVHREWTGYGCQKQFAERQCRHEWVLNVDADEVVTRELADEIQSLFREGEHPTPAAYKLRILTVYPGDRRPRPFAKDYNIVRLYHKSVGTYRDHPVFDRVILYKNLVRQLQQPILHYSYTSFSHIIEKNNQFSSFRALQSSKKSKNYLCLRLFIEFPLNFFKYYFHRRHLTGGWKGFYFSICHAFMRTTRFAKALETAALTSEGESFIAAVPVVSGTGHNQPVIGLRGEPKSYAFKTLASEDKGRSV